MQAPLKSLTERAGDVCAAAVCGCASFAAADEESAKSEASAPAEVYIGVDSRYIIYGFYVNLEVGHTFALVGEGDERVPNWVFPLGPDFGIMAA